MKKMSEVRSDGYGNFVSSNETMVIKSSNELALKNAINQINQINHADELADALEEILNSFQSTYLRNDHYESAQKALAAYRGEV